MTMEYVRVHLTLVVHLYALGGGRTPPCNLITSFGGSLAGERLVT